MLFGPSHVFAFFLASTMQSHKCRGCSKKFIHNLGFERKWTTPEQTATAVHLPFSGLSGKVSYHLSKVDPMVSHRTVQDRGTEYAGMMERLVDIVTPMVGEQCMADEIYTSIRGESTRLPCRIQRLGSV